MAQPHDNDGAGVETVAEATATEELVPAYKGETQAIDALARDSST